jgi:hypothetical protein
MKIRAAKAIYYARISYLQAIAKQKLEINLDVIKGF